MTRNSSSSEKLVLYFTNDPEITSLFIWPLCRHGSIQENEKRVFILDLCLGNSLFFCSANLWWDGCLWATHSGGKRRTTKMGSLAAAWGRTLVPFRKEWAKLWRLSIGEFRAPPGLSKPSSEFLWWVKAAPNDHILLTNTDVKTRNPAGCGGAEGHTWNWNWNCGKKGACQTPAGKGICGRPPWWAAARRTPQAASAAAALHHSRCTAWPGGCSHPSWAWNRKRHKSEEGDDACLVGFFSRSTKEASAVGMRARGLGTDTLWGISVHLPGPGSWRSHRTATMPWFPMALQTQWTISHSDQDSPGSSSTERGYFRKGSHGSLSTCSPPEGFGRTVFAGQSKKVFRILNWKTFRSG